MAVEFKLPELGENIEEGDVINVLVQEGQTITKGQAVLEIETGKAVVELPCPLEGRIARLHVGKGSKVRVGEPLLSLETAAAAAPAEKPPASDAGDGREPVATRPPKAAPARPKAKAPAKSTAEDEAPPPPAATQPTPSKATPPAGPATRRLARELGVDISSLSGSGVGGRITEEDIKAAVRQSTSTSGQRDSAAASKDSAARAALLPDAAPGRDNFGPIRRQKMSGIRKATAVNMARSASTIPHVTNFDDADITELERIRTTGLVDYVDSSVKLTMLSFVLKAVAQSLRLHPAINASLDMEAGEVVYKDYVHLGIAVDTDRGLIVPVLRDVDRMSIPRIAQALSTIAQQARGGQFKLEELQGSTFTVSNLGAIGGTFSTPIINPPNVAILLTGRSRKLPIVGEGDRIEPRLMMPLSLSYDHRLVDGATAARFLNEVKDYLAVPGRLLLAP